jgi:hypothetical protein
VIASYKHSSIVGLVISNEGKKFYNIDTWVAALMFSAAGSGSATTSATATAKTKTRQKMTDALILRYCHPEKRVSQKNLAQVN